MNSSEAGDAPRVLIIEDEDGLRAAYERILRAAGMVVTACASAEAALERLRSGERFSVVVTDLVMSGMSGVDLLPVIRQSDPDVCIVIVTGRPSLRSSIAAIENGGFKYLLKPIAPRELCKTVNDAAARYRLATLTRRALEISAEDGRVSASGEELSRAFQTALDQLFIAYQPIVHAGGGTFGFEALVRTSDTTYRT
jgi:DNA-binding NtrC family response regulator